MRLSERDRMKLSYLKRAGKPLWGYHLEQGLPITDIDMQRWVDLHLIEAVEKKGYILTTKGSRALHDH